ncbi:MULTISPECIES: VOC family protein [unclassified Mesorhizobium]|uniref:VOC family protein n=1 Tax=unclassified Mesorhizobium TaxID=325217 RepID=UPI0016515131|nr:MULTISPECIES: VOC family protein [unclassified Mesorhizobium]
MKSRINLASPHQLGFVVDDLDSAIKNFAQTLNVGPFFVLDAFDYDIIYKGTKSKPRMSVAFSYMDETQIELICQHNDAPSVYSEFKSKHETGIVHLGYFVENPQDYLRALDGQAEVVQYGDDGVTKDSFYCSFAPFGGGLVEFTELHAPRKARWEFMKAAARDWDGKTLVRPYSDAVSK